MVAMPTWMKPREWTRDHDRTWGPFTYAPSGPVVAVILDSGKGVELPYKGSRFASGPYFRLGFLGHTLILALPPIIKPQRRWVDLSDRIWADGTRGTGYWDVNPREFGFSITTSGAVGDPADFLQVFLGPQTMDSSTTKSWSKFLPWASWRHVRRSLYGLAGEHVWTAPNRRRGRLGEAEWREEYDTTKAAEEACPFRTFAFLDFDGEALTVRTRIEEREWWAGEGWFKWLAWFRKPMIRRSLDLQFSGEVGKRKGSWKGGALGHAINMLPGELHESAFKRYCADHRMTFVGAVDIDPTPPSSYAGGGR